MLAASLPDPWMTSANLALLHTDSVRVIQHTEIINQRLEIISGTPVYEPSADLIDRYQDELGRRS